jgi:dipeptidase
MWGCEMGVNDRGVAIGNEAVFTRLRVPRTGLTGMDLVRLALERSTCAREALDVITDLLARYDQGGPMGYRSPRFRYHSAFAIADPAEAWILETAGPFWAAQRVRGLRTLSNALSIGADFDLVHERAFETARSRGWCSGARDFDFARCFGDRFYRVMAGGAERRACTTAAMRSSEPSLASLAEALRDHGGRSPEAGLRSIAPCAHASWVPTRSMAQTTGSLIARLGSAPEVWGTGTSAPCLGVFKPVPFAGRLLSRLPACGERSDRASLWWRQHRLHAVVLGDYAARRRAFEEERLDLEARAIAVGGADVERCLEIWQEHRERIPDWTARAARAGGQRLRPFHLYWRAISTRAS